MVYGNGMDMIGGRLQQKIQLTWLPLNLVCMLLLPEMDYINVNRNAWTKLNSLVPE